IVRQEIDGTIEWFLRRAQVLEPARGRGRAGSQIDVEGAQVELGAAVLRVLVDGSAQETERPVGVRAPAPQRLPEGGFPGGGQPGGASAADLVRLVDAEIVEAHEIALLADRQECLDVDDRTSDGSKPWPACPDAQPVALVDDLLHTGRRASRVLVPESPARGA